MDIIHALTKAAALYLLTIEDDTERAQASDTLSQFLTMFLIGPLEGLWE